MHRVQIQVEGLVQGVGFRWFVQENASLLGLKGYVKNCVDGSVFIDVEGEHDTINQLIARVKKGPSRSMVNNITITEQENNQGFEHFTIKY